MERVRGEFFKEKTGEFSGGGGRAVRNRDGWERKKKQTDRVG